MDRVAVIVVTFNGMKWLKKCLYSIFQSSIPLEVYVVDNGSLDGTVEFLERDYPNIKLVKASKNLGFGKANNIGIEKALEDGADYFFLLNQDGYVQPDTVATLVSFAKKKPQYGVISPIQLNGEGSDLDRNFAILMNHGNCPYFINDNYFHKLREHYEVKFVMAAFWLMTKEVVEKVGVFNPVFPHYGEDNDYLNRVAYHGYKVGILTTTSANHDRENRSISVEKQIYQGYINHLIGINDLRTNFLIEFCRAFASFLKNFFLKISNFTLLKYEVRYFWNIILFRTYMSLNHRKVNRKRRNN